MSNSTSDRGGGEQTGAMLVEIERALSAVAPSVAVVQRDANSALAGAIAANKMESAVAHVDAGLRSFDRTTPEETNRVVADCVADYLFVATEKSRFDILSALKNEDSHGSAPLSWDIVVCSCPAWTATGCANQPVLLLG
ncbi:hypothetical protein BRD22_06445 [Halobacteriales archaeon SW_8_68_21]|nr:MAG: hypothetical protein BRD22_06445 [Halobacteriales archaeon SW_8_68_21]